MSIDAAQLQHTFVTEVRTLHTYLEHWLKGNAPEGKRQLTRLENALAKGFYVIHPDGRRADRAAVIRTFDRAFGNESPGYRLEISELEVRVTDNRLGIATYKESHHGGGGRTRISTAVLRQRPYDCAIEWLVLQETFIANPGLDDFQQTAVAANDD